MKLLTALAVLLPLTVQARIGETIGQATTRLGPPTDRSGQDSVAPDPFSARTTYVWKRPRSHREDKHTITIEFRNGKSFQETIEFDPGSYTFKREPFLAAAAPGPWRAGDLPDVSINGILVAVSLPSQLIIAAAPPISVKENDRTTAEGIALAQLNNTARRAEIAKSIATEDQDKKAGIQWLGGKVLSKFREGLLVTPSASKNFPSNVLLIGHDLEGQLVDGSAIAARVKIAGTFQYSSTLGAVHTIYKVQYVGDIPLPTTAAK